MALNTPPHEITPQDKEEDNNQISENKIYDLFRDPARFQPKLKRTPKRKHDESETDCWPRTPSGQVLTVTVGDRTHMLESRTSVTQPIKASHLNQTVCGIPESPDRDI